MNIEVPYNYLILQAFKNYKKYENNNALDIKVIDNYIKAILKEVIDIYENRGEEDYEYAAKVDMWTGKIKFITLDKNDYLIKFLDKYKAYFKKEGNLIIANDDIDFEGYYQLLNQEKITENISNRFYTPNEFSLPLKCLKIKKLEQFIQLYLQNEKKLEEGIMKGANNITLTKHILIRNSLLTTIDNLPAYTVDALRNLAYNIKIQSEDVLMDNYQYFINLDMWLSSDNCKNNLNYDMDSRICNLFQYAIFGDGSLAEEKLLLMLEDKFLEKSCFNELENISLDSDEEEELLDTLEEDYILDMEEETIEIDEEIDENYFDIDTDSYNLFYLNIIERINNYFLNFGYNEQLDICKKRLIYLIDMPDKCLVIDKNLNKEISKHKGLTLEAKTSKFLKKELEFMADEIFWVGFNEFTILKLIFMGAYYDLTQDDDFKKIFEKHNKEEVYQAYATLLFNNMDNYGLKKEKDK